MFHSSIDSSQLSVSHEGVEYEIRHIDGIDYHIFTAVDTDKDNSILWESNGQRYDILSTIPIDELLRIAFSVES